MYLSELQAKNVITINGKLIGNIVDVLIDNGKIKHLLVERSKGIHNFLSNKEELEVLWENINTIGEDVIIVNCKLNDKK